jgi:hypothetical protein
MKKIKLLFVLVAVCICSQIFSQGFTPPEEGNAVIYIVRVTKWGGSTSFEYFHNENFIGVFKGKNYIRYECPAGEQLIWASSENKEFLRCDFAAGETYMALVNVIMGRFKARIGLEPLTVDNEDFERAKELVNDKEPVVTSDSKIESIQKKLEERGFIENIMEKYENEWKDASATKVISSDMFIPKENLE